VLRASRRIHREASGAWAGTLSLSKGARGTFERFNLPHIAVSRRFDAPRRFVRLGAILKRFQYLDGRAVALIVISLIAGPAATFAQTDEIQVYDAESAEPGQQSLLCHRGGHDLSNRDRFPQTSSGVPAVENRKTCVADLNLPGTCPGFSLLSVQDCPPKRLHVG
jgi:hypothetical protein